MIQRIQSVYLFLIIVLAGLVFFFPLSTFTIDTVSFDLNIFGLKGDGTSEMEFPAWGKFVPALMAVLLASSSLVSLLNFRNRKTQLKVNSVGLLINLGLMVSIFVLTDSIAKSSGSVQEYAYGAYFPIGSALLFILSNRSIRADEAKIKSADRMR